MKSLFVRLFVYWFIPGPNFEKHLDRMPMVEGLTKLQTHPICAHARTHTHTSGKSKFLVFCRV